MQAKLTTLSEYATLGSRPPTMRDVAAVARVSVKTVSRVINHEAGVKDALRARVLEAVDLLDYRHNLTASSLRRTDGKTASIGLLLEDVANPFSSALHRAIENLARERSTLVLAGSGDEDPAREQELLRAFASRRVDGLIIVPTSQVQTSLSQERRLSTPMVFVDRPAGFASVDTVLSDNRGGARQAIEHLARHGHERIAFLGDRRSIWTAEERYRGYVDALASTQVPLDMALVRQDPSGSGAAEEATLDLFDATVPPTAIFTGQNLVTMGAVRALRRLGLHNQVALVGFDDFVLADMLSPAATVVAQDPAEMGRQAAALLFSRLDGSVEPPQHIVLPTQLILRGSGELPPSRTGDGGRRGRVRTSS